MGSDQMADKVSCVVPYDFDDGSDSPSGMGDGCWGTDWFSQNDVVRMVIESDRLGIRVDADADKDEPYDPPDYWISLSDGIQKAACENGRSNCYNEMTERSGCGGYKRQPSQEFLRQAQSMIDCAASTCSSEFRSQLARFRERPLFEIGRLNRFEVGAIFGMSPFSGPSLLSKDYNIKIRIGEEIREFKTTFKSVYGEFGVKADVIISSDATRRFDLVVIGADGKVPQLYVVAANGNVYMPVKIDEGSELYLLRPSEKQEILNIFYRWPGWFSGKLQVIDDMISRLRR